MLKEKRELQSLLEMLEKDGVNANVGGLKTVIEEAKCIPDGFHLQLMWDSEGKKLFTGDLLTDNSWEEYHDEGVIVVGAINGYDDYNYSSDDVVNTIIERLWDAVNYRYECM